MDRTMFRGDTFRFYSQAVVNPITGEMRSVPQGTPPPAGFAPFNLTGARVWFTLKSYVNDPDQSALAQLDNLLLGGVTITNATAGQFTVLMPPSASIGMPDDGKAVFPYDVQMRDASGNIFTLETGTLSVNPDVTRAIA